MMNAESYKPKQIYFKAYQNLTLLQNPLKTIKGYAPSGLQVSILGTTTQFYRDEEFGLPKDMDVIKRYWEKTLHDNTDFGSLYNSEIGNLFVVGALTSTFFNKVDGKTLGMLSVGPYGILRGIGASEEQANAYIALLKNDNYLLIIRGVKDELDSMIKVLENTKKE